MNRKLALFILLVSLVACSKDEATSDKIEFKKQATPVWEGTFTAADPSVIRDGDTLRMYYSSLLMSPTEKLVISGAKSADGIHWIPANDVQGKESVALDVTDGTWDDHLEAVTVFQDGDETWMYYCGYPEEADVAGTIVAEGEIGLAKSDDKITFNRTFDDPILPLGTTNSKDANALFSPTFIKEGSTYYMFYVGYCIENCTPPFIGILGAT
jgi:hypothetical protein